ncbi:uncharacterized protein LOC109880947 [Oncorhynchus kisutch]|uniref:uncharacterized protein LOC109880947 n=1 Tax=Oncorhynchus kisutch TaxID=8019 RepID=UPI0012DDE9E8|nr:uncharacterized protein LOC109880947 [Oncorhynchus kisutch]
MIQRPGVLTDSLNEVAEKKRQREESPPTTGRGAKKRCNVSTKSPEKNIMVEVVITYNPKLCHPKPGVGSPDNKGRMWKQKRKVIASEFSGMIENLAMGNVVTFAKLALTNENISQEIRKEIVNKIQVEVTAYARLPNVFEPCILSSTSLENMKYFSYEALDNELSRKTPWLYTTINTATGGSTIHNCVAASVALRGRNPRLSALAYVINSTLTPGGVKPIFKRLSKMGIVTSYQCASSKQKEMRAAGYNIIKCWREDCELFFQHSVSGEVCPRPPPTAKLTEETGREEDGGKDKVEVGGPVDEEWGFLLGETEREEDRGSIVQEEREEEKDRGSLLGETETEEDRGSTVQEERGEERRKTGVPC